MSCRGVDSLDVVIVCLGDLLEDIVVWPQAPQRPGTDTPARVHHRRGGSAANVASVVARSGGSARFVGCVGADDRGDSLVAELEADGVEVCATRHPRLATGTIVVVVDSQGERSFLTDRGACLHLVDPRATWLDGARALHVPAYSFTEEPLAHTAVTVLVTARSRGIPVSIDASSTGALEDMGVDHFLAVLDAVRPDVLLANQAEAQMLNLSTDRGLPGVGTTIITQGIEPTVVVSADGATETVPVPPTEAPVIDTTGAGDAFAAGWLLARSQGRSIVDAVALGHALAARILAQPGADLPPLIDPQGGITT